MAERQFIVAPTQGPQAIYEGVDLGEAVTQGLESNQPVTFFSTSSRLCAKLGSIKPIYPGAKMWEVSGDTHEELRVLLREQLSR